MLEASSFGKKEGISLNSKGLDLADITQSYAVGTMKTQSSPRKSQISLQTTGFQIPFIWVRYPLCRRFPIGFQLFNPTQMV